MFPRSLKDVLAVFLLEGDMWLMQRDPRVPRVVAAATKHNKTFTFPLSSLYVTFCVELE